MGLSKCNRCDNMIKAEVREGGDDPQLWACTHPLRSPVSCYGSRLGTLDYQDTDCPDRTPGDCHRFTYNEEDSAELRKLTEEHGEYDERYLTRGVEIAVEDYV